MKQQKRHLTYTQSNKTAVAINHLFDKALKLHQLLKLDEAKKIYEEIVVAQPNHASAHYNLGTIFQEQNKLSEAVRMYEKAIDLNLNHANVYYNLGVIFKEQDKFFEAITMYEKAIALNPNHTNAYNNLGNIFKEQNKLFEALTLYQKAISLNPNYANAYLNISLIFLIQGDYQEGFALYEKRWDIIQRRNFSQPIWQGVDVSIEGKTLLLYSEQGLGDTIQFCRYIEMVSKLGCNIILEVEKTLLPLILQLKGVACFVEKGKELPLFDYHCSLLSLPFAFKTTLSSIPSKQSYFNAKTQKINSWRNRFSGTSEPKIGLAWSGSETNKGDANRSIHLDKLLQYLPEGFEYICLQKELRVHDKDTLENSSIYFFGEELNDFSDTAALCSAMDLVISVDTVIAHLSAALGKDTFVLLPFEPDWRWMLHRSDSPWYPTVRLFRQDAIKDWEGVLINLKQSILDFFAKC